MSGSRFRNGKFMPLISFIVLGVLDRDDMKITEIKRIVDRCMDESLHYSHLQRILDVLVARRYIGFRYIYKGSKKIRQYYLTDKGRNFYRDIIDKLTMLEAIVDDCLY